MPRKSKQFIPTTANHTLCILLVFSLFFISVGSLLTLQAILKRANALGRSCISFSGEVPAGFRSKIAIVSLSDESKEGIRPFEGLMKTVKKNKEEYARKNGYDFLDASGLIDPSRPPSWSKILAVRFFLPSYDWIFWNDADSLITNNSISLESILLEAIGSKKFHDSPNLVITEDITGINAGAFFVRRSRWSMNFLDSWWNLTDFIQFGSTKSGDNDALKFLIRNLLPTEHQTHVRVASMQCLFNSYPWFPSWKKAYGLFTSPKVIWQGAYSDGDFMVHLAGLDRKKRWVSKILHEIQTTQVHTNI